MKDLGEWSDYHLDPPEDKIIGYDWKGGELYGYEHGYIIDGDFVIEDDVIEYLDARFDLVIASDVMGANT